MLVACIVVLMLAVLTFISTLVVWCVCIEVAVLMLLVQLMFVLMVVILRRASTLVVWMSVLRLDCHLQ